MALNIKDEETDRLARELAAATGESITTAARRAIEERLVRVRIRQEEPAMRDQLHALIRAARIEQDFDRRSSDEILGYDSDGLPT